MNFSKKKSKKSKKSKKIKQIAGSIRSKKSFSKYSYNSIPAQQEELMFDGIGVFGSIAQKVDKFKQSFMVPRRHKFLYKSSRIENPDWKQVAKFKALQNYPDEQYRNLLYYIFNSNKYNELNKYDNAIFLMDATHKINFFGLIYIWLLIITNVAFNPHESLRELVQNILQIGIYSLSSWIFLYLRNNFIYKKQTSGLDELGVPLNPKVMSKEKLEALETKWAAQDFHFEPPVNSISMSDLKKKIAKIDQGNDGQGHLIDSAPTENVYSINGPGVSRSLNLDLFIPVPENIILITFSKPGNAIFAESTKRNRLFYYMMEINHYMLKDPLKYWSSLSSEYMFGKEIRLHYTKWNDKENINKIHATTFSDQMFTPMNNFVSDKKDVTNDLNKLINSTFMLEIAEAGIIPTKVNMKSYFVKNEDSITLDLLKEIYKNDIYITSADLENEFNPALFRRPWMGSHAADGTFMTPEGVRLGGAGPGPIPMSLEMIGIRIHKIMKRKFNSFDDNSYISIKEVLNDYYNRFGESYKKNAIFYYWGCRTELGARNTYSYNDRQTGLIRREFSGAYRVDSADVLNEQSPTVYEGAAADEATAALEEADVEAEAALVATEEAIAAEEAGIDLILTYC